MTRRAIWVPLAFVAALVVLVMFALLASAVSDEPSQTIRASTTVSARERDVWRLLTDLAGYSSWNPTIVKASGTLQQGTTLKLRVKSRDGDVESRDVSVLDVRPIHKLRWQDRLLLPGVRDREVTFRVRSYRLGETVVTAAERYEGLLAPFADTGEEKIGLDRMLAALKLRAEAS